MNANIIYLIAFILVCFIPILDFLSERDCRMFQHFRLWRYILSFPSRFTVTIKPRRIIVILCDVHLSSTMEASLLNPLSSGAHPKSGALEGEFHHSFVLVFLPEVTVGKSQPMRAFSRRYGCG